VLSVKAASVNFPDVLIIQNKYQFKPPLPFSPGSELAGVVKEVGAGVAGFKPGDKVIAFTTYGAFAEEAKTEAARLLPLPQGMDFVTGAAFLLTYATSDHALRDRGALRAGETLLVLGAAGGVGLAALQLGKLMGARVIAAASSDDKLAFCKSQGADEVVNYSKESLKESVKKLTKGQGADVIYDPVGGDLTQDCFSCINWNGRHLVVGFAAGKIPEVALNRLLLKGAAAVGVFWGAFVAREPKVNWENFQQLFAWYAEGKLKPHVSKAYPLAQAGAALRDMLERKVTGKIVLVP
jgi:NADPH2:quinone reductase